MSESEPSLPNGGGPSQEPAGGSRSSSPGVKRRVSEIMTDHHEPPQSDDDVLRMEWEEPSAMGEVELPSSSSLSAHRRAMSVDMIGSNPGESHEDGNHLRHPHPLSEDHSHDREDPVITVTTTTTTAEDLPPQLTPNGEELPTRSAESLYPTPSSRSADIAPTTTSEETKWLDAVDTHEPMPSIDEQVKIVTELMTRPLKEKQKGYVLSTSWLNRVLSRSSQPQRGSKIDKSAAEGDIGPVNNTDLVWATDPTPSFDDEAGEPFVPLRPGLQYGEDFEIVPQEAWERIMKWYGLADRSLAVVRYSHNTNPAGSTENVQYEINPPVFTILKLSASPTSTPAAGVSLTAGKDKSPPPVKTLASRHTSFQKWLRNVKTLVSIDLSTKVRVWRILGGLRNAHTPGALTPDASRSSSPQPGATLVPHAGNSLSLDVQTFVSLTEGSQRELLEDARDQTTNENYNGSMTLELAGLSGNDVVLLEEQIGGPGGGEWASDVSKQTLHRLSLAPNNTKTVPSKLKSKSASASGRSSPILEPMRGRRKDGKPRGNTGLSNLGNTCYMNSALQCVRSVEELTYYFLNDVYKQDLNPNNPLSHNGDVARAYAHLLHMMYDESGPSSFPPRQLKQTVGRYGPAFSGYGQQDSQEFLLFLLDGLQEDLNRIQKKPYIEKPDSTDKMVHDPAALKEFADKCWDIYKARNDSVITDLFAGMYKSTVVCPVCDKVSIIFDPFNNLTLQLPIENHWSKEIFYFPLHKPPVLIDVEIDKNATVKALKELIAKKMNYDPLKLVMAEVYKAKFYKIFDNTSTMAECQITNSDEIGMFEVECVPTNYNPDKPKKTFSMLSFSQMDSEEIPSFDSPKADRLLVPIFNRVVKLHARYQNRQLFGAPAFAVIYREEAYDYDSILRKVLAKVATLTTRDILHEEDEMFGTPPEEQAPDSDTVVMNEEDAESADSKIKASSVEGEDSLVDVSMRDASDHNGNWEVDSSANKSNGVLPPILRPGSLIPSKLRNLFDMKVVTSTTEIIPHGFSSLDENRDYPLLSSRLQKKKPEATPAFRRPKMINRFADHTNSPASSDDDELNDAPEPVNRNLPKVTEESDGSDNIPESRPISESESDSDLYSGVGLNRLYSRSTKRSRRTGAVQSENNRGPLIRPGEGIVLDWKELEQDGLFGADARNASHDGFRGSPTWTNIERIPDPELAKRRQLRQTRKKRGITLEECLDEFGKEEILSENDAWYCPRCKEHRRASKKFELWKAPDILVMHLKRFSANRGFRDKLDVFVDFPVEGLDLTGRVAAPDEGKSPLYDLFAVDNHYGGLGGGHYTAYAKNFLTGEWNEYNDSHVSKSIDPQKAVTAAAYLLFYRRRSDSSLGGRILQNITDPSVRPTTDSDSPTESHTESPSGEGRRLGGSSRNGSSGALIGVGAAHQAGVGGLRAVTQVRNEEDDDDAMPPEYSNGLPSGEQTLETVHCSDDMELIEDIFHGTIHPNSLQFENEMWPLESAADPVGASQISKAPPGSYCEDEDSFDDNSSNKAVRGGDLSDSDIRLGTTSAGSPDDSGAPFPSTSFEDPPVRVISPPSDVDDAN